METIDKKECPDCGNKNIFRFGTAPEVGDLGPHGEYGDPSQHTPVYRCMNCDKLFIYSGDDCQGKNG